MKGKNMEEYKAKELDERMEQCSCECENNDNCVTVEYDIDAFNDGVESMSKFCGRVAALINLGVSPDNALAYFSHKLELSTSKEITQIESNCHIECAKNLHKDAMDEDL